MPKLIIVAGSPLRFEAYSNHGILARFIVPNMRFFSFEAGFKVNKNRYWLPR